MRRSQILHWQESLTLELQAEFHQLCSDNSHEVFQANVLTAVDQDESRAFSDELPEPYPAASTGSAADSGTYHSTSDLRDSSDLFPNARSLPARNVLQIMHEEHRHGAALKLQRREERAKMQVLGY